MAAPVERLSAANQVASNWNALHAPHTAIEAETSSSRFPFCGTIITVR